MNDADNQPIQRERKEFNFIVILFKHQPKKEEEETSEFLFEPIMKLIENKKNDPAILDDIATIKAIYTRGCSIQSTSNSSNVDAINI